MRGTVAKRLSKNPETRKKQKAVLKWRARGEPADTGAQGVPRNYAPLARFKAYHPLREVRDYLKELSPKGLEIAGDLIYGKGGKPGTGAASRLSRPALIAQIRGLQKHRIINVTHTL